jgi:POT family proton-dependent oligopeptide transporter
MKGAIMSFWNLSTTVGNLWVLIVNAASERRRDRQDRRKRHQRDGLPDVLLRRFAVAMLAFGLYAKRYKMVDNYRKTAVPA